MFVEIYDEYNKLENNLDHFKPQEQAEWPMIILEFMLKSK